MNVLARFAVTTRVSCVAILLLTGRAVAQESPPRPAENWDIGVWVAGSTGEETQNSFTQAQIWSAGAFVGKVFTGEIGRGWLRGNLEYGFALIPVFVQSKPQTIYGGGFEPVILRWNVSHRLSHATPYIELAGGGVRTTSNLPSAPDTSDFNFTARGGGGMRLFTRKRQSVDIGCQWTHVSNANLGTRNPEFNGIQVSVGYHWLK